MYALGGSLSIMPSLTTKAEKQPTASKPPLTAPRQPLTRSSASASAPPLVPPGMTALQEYVGGRVDDIRNMLSVLAADPAGSFQPAQVQNCMRRRGRSYKNSKRRPTQTADDVPRPAMKTRWTAKYLPRERTEPPKELRLACHLWHAKRFHCGRPWPGWYLPLSVMDKGTRALYRMCFGGAGGGSDKKPKKRPLLHDMSYLREFSLEGPGLLARLKCPPRPHCLHWVTSPSYERAGAGLLQPLGLPVLVWMESGTNSDAAVERAKLFAHPSCDVSSVGDILREGLECDVKPAWENSVVLELTCERDNILGVLIRAAEYLSRTSDCLIDSKGFDELVGTWGERAKDTGIGHIVRGPGALGSSVADMPPSQRDEWLRQLGSCCLGAGNGRSKWTVVRWNAGVLLVYEVGDRTSQGVERASPMRRPYDEADDFLAVVREARLTATCLMTALVCGGGATVAGVMDRHDLRLQSLSSLDTCALQYPFDFPASHHQEQLSIQATKKHEGRPKAKQVNYAALKIPYPLKPDWSQVGGQAGVRPVLVRPRSRGNIEWNAHLYVQPVTARHLSAGGGDVDAAAAAAAAVEQPRVGPALFELCGFVVSCGYGFGGGASVGIAWVDIRTDLDPQQKQLYFRNVNSQWYFPIEVTVLDPHADLLDTALFV